MQNLGTRDRALEIIFGVHEYYTWAIRTLESNY